jgi:hypothetical protein
MWNFLIFPPLYAGVEKSMIQWLFYGCCLFTMKLPLDEDNRKLKDQFNDSDQKYRLVHENQFHNRVKYSYYNMSLNMS